MFHSIHFEEDSMQKVVPLDKIWSNLKLEGACILF
jgi:hypothetical protein